MLPQGKVKVGFREQFACCYSGPSDLICFQWFMAQSGFSDNQKIFTVNRNPVRKRQHCTAHVPNPAILWNLWHMCMEFLNGIVTGSMYDAWCREHAQASDLMQYFQFYCKIISNSMNSVMPIYPQPARAVYVCIWAQDNAWNGKIIL